MQASLSNRRAENSLWLLVDGRGIAELYVVCPSVRALPAYRKLPRILPLACD